MVCLWNVLFHSTERASVSPIQERVPKLAVYGTICAKTHVLYINAVTSISILVDVVQSTDWHHMVDCTDKLFILVSESHN
jgi:hypothetical protein